MVDGAQGAVPQGLHLAAHGLPVLPLHEHAERPHHRALWTRVAGQVRGLAGVDARILCRWPLRCYPPTDARDPGYRSAVHVPAVLRHDGGVPAAGQGGECAADDEFVSGAALHGHFPGRAGVSLGLAAEVKELITDDWGAEFSATIVAAVVINQVIGPVLCSLGLRGAGESMIDRQAAAAAAAQSHTQTQPEHEKDQADSDIEAGKDDRKSYRTLSRHNSTLSRHNSTQALFSTRGGGKDPRPLLPFYRVKSAVVLGDDEVAFEIALELSLYGARVNVPLLDEARADKWRRMNETILQRTAKGELISFQNSIQDRHGDVPADSGMQNADVLIFTGAPERSLEHARVMQTMLGEHARPRLIAVVDDCAAGAKLRELGVLTVQPSIALGNIVTRLALLDAPLAANLSKELSSTSTFSTAAYFRSDAEGDRDSLTSLSELRLPGRRLALGRSVVNHHSVDYDRLAEALAAENLPMPPPPSRVSMFGTSAAGFDPFARRGDGMSAYEHFVVQDEPDPNDETVFNSQFVQRSPRLGVFPSPHGSNPYAFVRSRSSRNSGGGRPRLNSGQRGLQRTYSDLV
ncbi:hypothetical protein ON010_g16316 [Phytophthora cinnamomi]|nr:hypothetical protein ON010_g16316 [Phytophthora cinnamomi]